LEDIESRKEIVEAHAQTGEQAISNGSLLMAHHCLCVSPPASACVEDLLGCQTELHACAELFSSLDGKYYDGKKLKISIITDPSLTVSEAVVWNSVWEKLTMKDKKRY
jgi:hypothetical protein